MPVSFQTCIVLPAVISPIAVATIWRRMYQRSGEINQMLDPFGLKALATSSPGSPDVVLCTLALSAPVFVFKFTAYFVAVPKALQETAHIDGVTESQIYRRVIMPIALPVVVTTALPEFLRNSNELFASVAAVDPG